MSCICLIDTSVFLNLLNVPGRNQDRETVTQEFREYVELDTTFILPMATILETGNHIAQNGNGAQRRQTAQRFCDVVMASLKGDTPYRPADFPNTEEMLRNCL